MPELPDVHILNGKNFFCSVYMEVITNLLNISLMKKLLPDIQSIVLEVHIFQQDNALAHRARQTVELLRREKS